MFAESSVISYIVYTCKDCFSFPYDKVIEVLCEKIFAWVKALLVYKHGAHRFLFYFSFFSAHVLDVFINHHI